jgi:hypothetical protein
MGLQMLDTERQVGVVNIPSESEWGHRNHNRRQASEAFARDFADLTVGVFYNPEVVIPIDEERLFYDFVDRWVEQNGRITTENLPGFRLAQSSFFAQNYAEEKEELREILIERIMQQAEEFLRRIS